MGYVAYLQGEYDKAQALLEQGLATLHRESEVEFDIGWILVHLGEVADARGEHEAAYPPLLESLAIWREREDRWSISLTLHYMGRVALHQGDYRRARAWFAESLTISQEEEGRACLVDCLEGLAGAACQQGQPVRAARLLGAAAGVRASSTTVRRPTDRADLERSLAALRAALSETAFAAAWAEGQAMPLETAIADALQDGEE